MWHRVNREGNQDADAGVGKSTIFDATGKYKKYVENLLIKFFELEKKRSEPDSNRCRWFCRPLPSHSAIRPFIIKNQCKLK